MNYEEPMQWTITPHKHCMVMTGLRFCVVFEVY